MRKMEIIKVSHNLQSRDITKKYIWWESSFKNIYYLDLRENFMSQI